MAKKGCVSWNKGKRLSEETKNKISKNNAKYFKGKKCTEERKIKISKATKGKNKGKHFSPLTEFKKGSSGFSGGSHSEKTRKIMRRIKRGKPWPEARRKAQEDRKGKPYVQRKPRKPYPKSRKLKSKPVIKNGKEYHPNWHVIRKEIYKRDNWTCQECGIKCHNTTKKKIQCHHIDYDESNNEGFNLITLCASCHGRTNGSRKDWIKYFKGF